MNPILDAAKEIDGLIFCHIIEQPGSVDVRTTRRYPQGLYTTQFEIGFDALEGLDHERLKRLIGNYTTPDFFPHSPGCGTHPALIGSGLWACWEALH